MKEFIIRSIILSSMMAALAGCALTSPFDESEKIEEIDAKILNISDRLRDLEDRTPIEYTWTK